MRHRTPQEIAQEEPRLTELRVAYTRGRSLHAAMFPEPTPTNANAGKMGHTLCGHFGFRHPDFDSPDTAVELQLRMTFAPVCSVCQRKLEEAT